MSVNAVIARKTRDGYEAVYLHFGLPDYNFPILKRYYKTPARVRELLALGDLSSLGRDIGEEHDFDDDSGLAEKKGWVTAYGRDRGEKKTGAKSFKTYAALDDYAHHMANYLYLFSGGKWTKQRA